MRVPLQYRPSATRRLSREQPRRPSMKFGLFGGARARGGPAGDSYAYHDFINYVVEAEQPRLFERFSGRTPFHRLWPGLGVDELAELSGRAHRAHSPRHRGRRVAVAQSDPRRRAGRDTRSPVERPARFRGRQGLPELRVLRVLHPARRGDRALRRGDGGDPQGVDDARPVLLSRQALAVRQRRRRAEPDPAAAPAVLARRRQRRIDPPCRARRIQSAARPDRTHRSDHRARRRPSARNASGSAGPTTRRWSG